MTKEEYLESILSYIDDKYARLEVKAELEAHLDDRIAFYTDAGYNYDYALDKAIEKMGDARSLGMQLDAVHSNKKAQILIWITAGLFLITAVLFRFYYFIEEYFIAEIWLDMFSISSTVFHTGVFLFTACFLLASKHKNYKALLFISTVNLFSFGNGLCYLYLGDGFWWLSPLYSPSTIFTYRSDSITEVLENIFNAFGIFDTVFMLFAGVFGILFALQIRLHLFGKAKTNILKRYHALNSVTIIAFSTEILSVIIFLLSFIFLMRS